jgi:hypothetical protein
MKDKVGRIICTGDVIVYAATGRSSSLDIYYVLDGYNDGDKIRVLMANPWSVAVMPETNAPRMFSTGDYNPSKTKYEYRSMSRAEIQHLLKKGTSHLKMHSNAYIVDDVYAQEVKRVINAHR